MQEIAVAIVAGFMICGFFVFLGWLAYLDNK